MKLRKFIYQPPKEEREAPKLFITSSQEELFFIKKGEIFLTPLGTALQRAGARNLAWLDEVEEFHPIFGWCNYTIRRVEA